MGIKEIAEKAGVSKTTVSLALNGHKGVSHETRMRILSLAQEMQYRVPGERIVSHPSQGFIMFARFRKHGLILNQDQSSFIMDYIDSINQTVCEAGYTFEIVDYQCQFVSACVGAIQNRRPKGVIILGTELDEVDIRLLGALTIPYVVIDTFFDHVQCDFVDMANIGAVYQLISYLKDKGNQTIGMVTCSVKSGNVLMRERAFLLAMQEFGMHADADSFFTVEPGFSGAYNSMVMQVTPGRSLPQALFCYNDIAAYGTMKALKERGLSIPMDISLIGFDDLAMSAMMEPHLTSIKVPNHQLGRKAAQLLLEKIVSKRTHEPVSILIGGSLVIRDSVMQRT
ncbi:MAG: LacI family DNA-binding transcriptional regulator [Sphaerochaeta sp.]|jgi:LacI family transcriptional regulator|uniref:LacI family DNA-binding transcriptional regulator n=1 Tax=Sphaerochaeta sp. TaxID=1972642 RepID=UPI002FC76EB5